MSAILTYRATICQWTRVDDQILICLLHRQPEELIPIVLAQTLINNALLSAHTWISTWDRNVCYIDKEKKVILWILENPDIRRNNFALNKAIFWALATKATAKNSLKEPCLRLLTFCDEGTRLTGMLIRTVTGRGVQP